MKTLLIALCLALAGCTTAGNLQKFLDTLPPTDIGEARSTLSSPLWSNDIKVNGVEVDANGLLDVKSASSELKIPLWGVVAETSLSDFKQIPTAAARAEAAAAKARKAELAAARAAQKAAAAKQQADEAAKIRAATPNPDE